MFRLEECVFLSIMRTCCLIRQKITGGKSIYNIEHLKWDAILSQYKLRNVEISTSKLTLISGNKNSRKNMTFIRIRTKSSSSYTKPIKQYSNQIIPPIIKMRQLTHLFLNSIASYIVDTINWSEKECVSVPTTFRNTFSHCSKSTSAATSTPSSTSTSHDNPPILPSIYPILDRLKINTSNIDVKDEIYLKNLSSEVSSVLTDNKITLNLEKWGSRGNKELIQIPSVGHLQYDRFKQNFKQNNFIEQTLKLYLAILMIITILQVQ